MLHCHIALIYYIAFVLLHFFDMLHCHISFMCFITFVLLHCFGMVHCHITLICNIATLLWYATLPYCFDMLHIATLLLFCYILIYMNAYYIAQWWKWAKWDSVATWTNIVVLLRFQHRTTCSKYDIQSSSSLSQSRWSFILLLCHRSACGAFFDDRSNNTTVYFSMVYVFDRV
jgi:hypothetical protein